MWGQNEKIKVLYIVSIAKPTEPNSMLDNREQKVHLIIVEAKLHGDSKVIQRCFDDNNDDNKR